MPKVKLGDCVRATCVHEEVGEVMGVVHEICANIVGVMTLRKGSYTCHISSVRIVPEEELDEAMLEMRRRYREVFRNRV